MTSPADEFLAEVAAARAHLANVLHDPPTNDNERAELSEFLTRFLTHNNPKMPRSHESPTPENVKIHLSQHPLDTRNTPDTPREGDIHRILEPDPTQ